MFIALDQSGSRITADEARKGVSYFCPVCEAPVTFKSGNVKMSHFSHHRIAHCIRYLYKKESLEHLEAKHNLYLELAGTRPVSMEYYLPGIEQIPDLLVEQERVLEIQYSAISPELIIERSKGYHSLGMDVIWLLKETSLKLEAGCIIPTHFQMSTAFSQTLFTYDNRTKRVKKWRLHHHLGGNRFTFDASVIPAEALMEDHPHYMPEPERLSASDIRRMIQREKQQRSMLNPTLGFLYQLGLDVNKLPAHLSYSVAAERWLMNPPLEWKLFIQYHLEKGTFEWHQFLGFIRMREIQDAPPKAEVAKALLEAYQMLYISQ